MNVNELMIGNWVKFGSNFRQVEIISKRGIQLTDTLDHFFVTRPDNNSLKPIQTTGDILLNSGYEKMPIHNKYHAESHWTEQIDYFNNHSIVRFETEYYLYRRQETRIYYLDNDEHYQNIQVRLLYANIKHLHNLQNLFYILNQKHLEIKL